MAKSIIGIVITRQEARMGYSFDRLTVKLIPLRWHDYLKEMAAWLHHPEIHNSLRDKALAAKRATDQTSVLQHQAGCGGNDIEIAWQGYKYASDSVGKWIAPRIDACYFDDASLAVLKKATNTMSALGRDASPQDFVEGLQAIGGLLVYWHKEADAYLPVDSYDLEAACSAEFVRA